MVLCSFVCTAARISNCFCARTIQIYRTSHPPARGERFLFILNNNNKKCTAIFRPLEFHVGVSRNIQKPTFVLKCSPRAGGCEVRYICIARARHPTHRKTLNSLALPRTRALTQQGKKTV
jgi:hypothetical protein